MKNQVKKQKKEWQKPAVRMLSIKKDTFSGSQPGVEIGGKRDGPPIK
jgi:hypothetical protein